MISNEENEKERQHYLAVKKLPALLCRKTSNRDGDFYCLNCLHSFRTENKLKLHEKGYEDTEFCNIKMPSGKNKVLKLNQQTKSKKIRYVVYADINCLVKKQIAAKTIHRFLQQQKQVSIFLVDTYYQQSEDLTTQRISILCTMENTV